MGPELEAHNIRKQITGVFNVFLFISLKVYSFADTFIKRSKEVYLEVI